MLRKDEAGYFERNAALERTIDEQRRWNEQLRNEFECLNDAIKTELALQQQPEHCPSYDKAQMEEAGATGLEPQEDHNLIKDQDIWEHQTF